MIIDKLIDRIIETKNPSVVGLDPRLSYIPEFITEDAFNKYGHTPRAVAESFFLFNKYIIDEIYQIVPAVKPQIAMYELYGAEGIDAYIRTVEYAKSKGLIVIGDIKRSDIASTAGAYSDGHIGRVKIGEQTFEIFKEDFITLNPYLGSDSVEPFLKNCSDYDKGLFMLIKTSNAGSGEIQDLLTDGRPVYEAVGELVSKWGEKLIGKHGFSSVGGVVGATYPSQAKDLRQKLEHTFFLVPGYGAQGGTADDLAVCFNSDGLGAIVNSSRGIIAAHLSDKYKEEFSGEKFAGAARLAAEDMRKDLSRICGL